MRSLTSLALDIHRDDYEEVLPPHLVRTEVISRTGHLTKFDTQAYRVRDDDLWLIPTGEVPLMGMHQGEILAQEDLPRRYMAYTVCWRREAGAAGKDTRGLQRVHEFHKVELVKLCRPEDSEAEFESLVADAERPLKMLGLPIPGGRAVCRRSHLLRFQGLRPRGLLARGRPMAGGVLDQPGDGLPVTAGPHPVPAGRRRNRVRPRPQRFWLATPRVWAALVEHGQQDDGTVTVPDAIAPYLGHTVIAKSPSARQNVGETRPEDSATTKEGSR